VPVRQNVPSSVHSTPGLQQAWPSLPQPPLKQPPLRHMPSAAQLPPEATQVGAAVLDE